MALLSRRKLLPRRMDYHHRSHSAPESQDPRDSITDVHYWRVEAQHYAQILNPNRSQHLLQSAEKYRESISDAQYWMVEARHYAHILNPNRAQHIPQGAEKYRESISDIQYWDIEAVYYEEEWWRVMADREAPEAAESICRPRTTCISGDKWASRRSISHVPPKPILRRDGKPRLRGLEPQSPSS